MGKPNMSKLALRFFLNQAAMRGVGTWCCFPKNYRLGEVKKLHYFEQDLVAYRGESGKWRYWMHTARI